jgi:hypothetical protein
MPDYAAIIEREFRKAVHDQAGVVYVDIADEEIMVTWRLQNFHCNCDDDENFVFTDPRGRLLIFPIPPDYLE